MTNHFIGCLAGICTGLAALPSLATGFGEDPITADPAAIAARIALPDGIGLAADGVTMVLSGVRPDTGAVSRIVYTLRQQGGDDYTLSASDQAQLAGQQALILGWMEDGIDVDGSFSVAIDPCLASEDAPRRARVSIGFRGTQGAEFTPVVENIRLQRLVGQPVRDLPRCGNIQ